MRPLRLFIVLSVIALSSAVLAQDDRGPMSRQMQKAISSFDHGRDAEAMDLFMEILMNGDPNERAMANEYLNAITQRINVNPHGGQNVAMSAGAPGAEPPYSAKPVAEFGGRKSKPKPKIEPPVEKTTSEWQAPKPKSVIDMPAQQSRESGATIPAEEDLPPAPPTRAMEPQDKPVAEDPLAKPAAAHAAPAPADAPKPTTPSVDRGAMRKDIEGKLRAKTKQYLSQLERLRSLRIISGDDGNPKALGIPAGDLFESGVVFRTDSARVLSALTGLVFSLGGAQVSILPEGAILGDSKVIDMRRSMAVSARLFSAGVAQCRVRVNLLQSQVDVPKSISEFRGMIVLFGYDQQMPLKAEAALAEEPGPVISLGVYPDHFAASQSEGSIIEWAVLDAASGVASWKFQVLQPAISGDMKPLQDVGGAGPVFHQVYWNGRKNYFDEVLPAGRYEVVLSATDSAGHTRKTHRFISVDLDAPVAQEPPPLIDPPAKARPAKKKPAEKKAAVKKKPRIAKAPKPAEAPPADPAAERSSGEGGAVSYKIGFTQDSEAMTQEGERKLAQVAETMTYYPYENLNLVGYAGATERGGKQLARERADSVSSILVKKYKIDPGRIKVETRVGGSSHEVEIYIVAGKE